MRIILYLQLTLLLHGFTAHGLTLGELEAVSDLNPSRLIQYFTDFQFHLRPRVQTPEDFLASRSGDCDDFANLSALVLKGKGFTPRVFVVSMERATHVVCYVAETQNYLDFNHRLDHALIPTNGTPTDIAQKVASSFQSRWYAVSEVTLDDGGWRFLTTEFP
jgi:transglutaminase-like putative cysteine protease